jgi:hypothetical protein
MRDNSGTNRLRIELAKPIMAFVVAGQGPRISPAGGPAVAYVCARNWARPRAKPLDMPHATQRTHWFCFCLPLVPQLPDVGYFGIVCCYHLE